jgi:anaerobic ribonucleoside-triphosphate reductase activating protein
MLIHAILPVSRVNGPGERFVLWTQGCRRRCPGCFNPATHARALSGRRATARKGAALPKTPGDIIFPARMIVEEIISYIPRGRVSGITVSGGEPFEQPGELGLLLTEAHRMGLHTLVYSGYTCEELRRLFTTILREIDLLIDGPYMRDVPRTSPWAGSGNQRILELRDGEAVPWDPAPAAGQAASEIHIDRKGRVTATGSFSIL